MKKDYNNAVTYGLILVGFKSMSKYTLFQKEKESKTLKDAKLNLVNNRVKNVFLNKNVVMYTTLKVLNFADDTLLNTTLKKNTYQRNNKDLNSELENVSKWLIDNRLKLNVNKTRYMLFYSSKTGVWKNTILDIRIGKFIYFKCFFVSQLIET